MTPKAAFPTGGIPTTPRGAFLPTTPRGAFHIGGPFIPFFPNLPGPSRDATPNTPTDLGKMSECDDEQEMLDAVPDADVGQEMLAVVPDANLEREMFGEPNPLRQSPTDIVKSTARKHKLTVAETQRIINTYMTKTVQALHHHKRCYIGSFMRIDSIDTKAVPKHIRVEGREAITFSILVVNEMGVRILNMTCYHRHQSI